MTAKRGLTKREAADYVGCKSLSSFNNWRDRGIVPGPIPGTRRWDSRALDAALDRLSGLSAVGESPVSAYDQWKAAQNARFT